MRVGVDRIVGNCYNKNRDLIYAEFGFGKNKNNILQAGNTGT